MAYVISLWAILAVNSLAALAAESGKPLGSMAVDLSDYAYAWTPAVPGTVPLVGVPDRRADLDKRACLSNGTNFCFDDEDKYCANCGICCGGSSGYCCASDQQCCGNACCASGQACSKGQCYLPDETITVTSTASVTVSHVATQVVTVFQIVVDTSTIVSTVSITVSSAATQTDVTYVTTTVVARRAAPLDTIPGRLERHKAPHPAQAPVSKPELARRDEGPTGDLATPIASTGVVTLFVTKTSDVTRTEMTTVTAPTTSLVLTTIFQTITKVLDAHVTVSITSIISVTSHAPTTESRTETPSPAVVISSAVFTPSTGLGPPAPAPTSALISSTPDPSASPATTPSSGGLSTGAIAGIAVGSALTLVLVAIASFLVCFRRRRRSRRAHQDLASYPDMDTRRPTLPTIFDPTAPHHEYSHDDHMSPPTDDPYAVSPMSPDSTLGHHRHVSGQTLVGSAHRTSTGGGAGKPGATMDDRLSLAKTSPVPHGGGGGDTPTPRIPDLPEFPDTQRAVEADGNEVAELDAGGGGGGANELDAGGGGAVGVPHRQQQQQQHRNYRQAGYGQSYEGADEMDAREPADGPERAAASEPRNPFGRGSYPNF